MVDRAEAHAMLDRVLDELERAEGANAPETLLEAENAAHEAWQDMAACVIGDVYARRRAAAACGRRPNHITAASPAAINVGKADWGAESLRDSDNRDMARRMLARFVQDHEKMLPPSLARMTAAALHSLSLGKGGTWLTKMTHGARMPKRAAERLTVDVALLCRIYYDAGYEGRSVEDIADEIAPAPKTDEEKRIKKNNKDWRSWDDLVKARQQINYTEICAEWKQRGQKDRNLGRPKTYPIGQVYDLKEHQRLARGVEEIDA